ncbi:MAG TPA: M28 family peptidase [Candidatus Cybelea sp.]|nr:M28 family peptidase [Candidatus Cybelea sp.]
MGIREHWFPLVVLSALLAAGCGHANDTSGREVASGPPSSPAASQAAAADLQAAIPPQDQAPPRSETGGFDGQRAYEYTAKLVSFGPRPPGSEAIHRTQDYLISELKGFCPSVDTDDFHASTPIGELPMKNIIAKIPGSGPGIILLLTHYDTLRLDDFVGADDGGSSSGLLLEMARVLCGRKSKPANSIWLAFLDGEEAQQVVGGVAQWTDTDSVFGSRELAARMAVSGDLKRIRALILADMVGQKDLEIPRERNSTKWLADLVWKTADRLGYGNVFVSRETTPIDDDHGPFLKRGVPAVDIIDLDGYKYWHTPQDTLDKISPKSLAVVGQVILESVEELERKFD